MRARGLSAQGARGRVAAVVALAAVGLLTLAAAAAAGPPDNKKKDDPPAAVHYDVSPPLRDLAPAPAPPPDEKKEKEPKKGLPVPAASTVPDPVVQTSEGTAAAPALGLGFDGVGQGFSGPSGSFTVNSAPPDSNGAVGRNHFVEVANSALAIFNKAGTPVYGPVPTRTLWSGFGGGCQSNNDGDATVAYDRLADRWVISQFSVSTTPYLQCVAVSTSDDPTGSYYRYAFQYGKFPDYPKLGVWPDAYYTTFNLFTNGVTFAGPEVCAYDRAKMLSGQAATQQCFTLGTAYGGLLPSDLDGLATPPPGSPNYVLSFGTNSLLLWRFHVDWTTPAGSTFTGPTTIPVAAFSPACGGGGTCIPQAGTSVRLDSLADRLMYRLAYRNFGDHESLVVNHSVTAGSSVGVRWYELRSPGSSPTVYQQGTYAPDGSYRWMGSMAMDGSGDIALGFSISSSTLRPGIHYTGRLAGDPLGSMTQGEGTVIDGSGSQTGSLSRWGDYTSMSVDPVDDCTFWYTNQYLAANGSFNWRTRIGSFTFPSCGAASDFSIAAGPSSVSIAQGGSGTSSISTAVTSGSAQTVSLSASGQPAGTTVSFNPSSVTAGNSSTMTVDVGAATAPGTYTITVTGTGTGTSASHTTPVTLTVTTAAESDFSISAGPSSLSVPQGANGTSTISTAVTSGSAQTVSLSASGQPPGTTITFNPDSVTAGGSSTMTVTVGTSTATGPYTITVTGSGTSATHTTTVALTVTASDFSIGASPTSLSVPQGANGTSTISTAVTSGSAQTVALSSSGQPAGTTVGFSPSSVTAGSSSTMTVSVGAGTAPGSYPITVTGTGATATHTTSVVLTVTASTGQGVVNGGFETGSLSGWTTSGGFLPRIVTPAAHSGAYSAQLGSTSAFNGNSTLSQTVTIPSGTSRLTFWYQPHCPDTITYDQIQMQLRSTAGATLATVLNVCSNSGAWTSVTYDTSAWAGQNVVLWFNDHDDGYPTDPTWFLLDDVAVNAYTPAPNVVQNPGFETGSLGSWATGGAFTPVISTSAHTGSYAARLGSTSAVNGNSTLTQTVTVPAGSSTLSFWYQPHCNLDTITYDQVQMQIRSTSGSTLATVLNVCPTSTTWAQVSYNASAFAGQTVVLWFNDHDDGYPSDPTYFLLDDVSLSSN